MANVFVSFRLKVVLPRELRPRKYCQDEDAAALELERRRKVREFVEQKVVEALGADNVSSYSSHEV